MLLNIDDVFPVFTRVLLWFSPHRKNVLTHRISQDYFKHFRIQMKKRRCV